MLHCTTAFKQIIKDIAHYINTVLQYDPDNLFFILTRNVSCLYYTFSIIYSHDWQTNIIVVILYVYQYNILSGWVTYVICVIKQSK